LPVLQALEGTDLWSDDYKEERAIAERLVRGVRRDEREGVLLPPGWTFTLLSTGGRRQFDTNAIVERYDKKVWLTADDERVCEICGAIDGESRNINALFSIGKLLPPAHPSCRCAVAYEEVAELMMPTATNTQLTNEGGGGTIDSGGDGMRDTGAFAWVDTLDEKSKIKFLGGKTKAALFDAGLLRREDYFKPLKEIDLSGILIPDRVALDHLTIGEYTAPSKLYPQGRLKGGGHTVAAMAQMDAKGIVYNIVRTDKNGVMFGNVPTHKDDFKKTGEGQTWFPKGWSKLDIQAAAIRVANTGTTIDAITKETFHKKVNVRVKIVEGRIHTAAPSYDQMS